MASAEYHDAVVREIRSEKAGALSRVADALERALADLARVDAAIESAAASASSASAALLAHREDCFWEACERLWYFVIQRESLGLMRHETVYDVYRVPLEVRRAMGPRRSSR